MKIDMMPFLQKILGEEKYRGDENPQMKIPTPTLEGGCWVYDRPFTLKSLALSRRYDEIKGFCTLSPRMPPGAFCPFSGNPYIRFRPVKSWPTGSFGQLSFS